MRLRDTEGAPLPDDDGKGWDLGLWGDGEMSVGIPYCIDLGEDYYAHGDHGGCHVFSVSLRDILQEYLERHEILDGKDFLLGLAGMLREFADKYEAAFSA